MRRILYTLTAVLGAAVAVLALSGTSWGAPIGSSTTLFASCATNDGNACAGYVMSGAQFQRVTDTAFTRNPDQYASITNGLGWQVGLKSVTFGNQDAFDAIIGISDVPDSGAGYSPQSLVYVNGTLVDVAPNALWCPAGGSCAPASAGGSFPVGTNVTETVSYNRTEGTVNFTARDTAGDLYKAFQTGLNGVSFDQARIEAGYGTFTSPAQDTKLVAINSASVTNYNGKTHTLHSFFTTSQEDGTSDGTGAGHLQAFPTSLSFSENSFNVDFHADPALHS